MYISIWEILKDEKKISDYYISFTVFPFGCIEFSMIEGSSWTFYEISYLSESNDYFGLFQRIFFAEEETQAFRAFIRKSFRKLVSAIEFLVL